MYNEKIRERIDLSAIMDGAKTCAVSGHVHPDGDCIGSCLGLALYLRKNWPDVKTDVYLDSLRSELSYIPGAETIITEPASEGADVFFCLDCAEADRIGKNASLFTNSKKTVCIDHHRTSEPKTDYWYVDPDCSSASELVAGLLGSDEIDKDMATALYTGIITDTGVFRYSSTSPETMRMAAILMEKGIDHSRICDEAFFTKTYAQQEILGSALLSSIRILDGQAVYSVITRKQMQLFGVASTDLDGISAQLKLTMGIHVSMLISEQSTGGYRVSLRSDETVDVSRIAAYFGGGGHLRAAGCTIKKDISRCIDELAGQIALQLG